MEKIKNKSEKRKLYFATFGILLGLLFLDSVIINYREKLNLSPKTEDALIIVAGILLVLIIVWIIFSIIKLLKSSIPIILLLFGISSLGNSQECTKENSFNFAVGSSFAKTSAPLMPSADLSINFKSIELEGFYKPSFYGGNNVWKHSFGGGMNIYLFKPGQYSRFFLSSSYVTNAAIEMHFEDPDNPKIISSEGISFFLGFQVLDFKHFTFHMKAGELFAPNIEKRIFIYDVGFKYYFKPVENQTLFGFFPKTRRL